MTCNFKMNVLDCVAQGVLRQRPTHIVNSVCTVVDTTVLHDMVMASQDCFDIDRLVDLTQYNRFIVKVILHVHPVALPLIAHADTSAFFEAESKATPSEPSEPIDAKSLEAKSSLSAWMEPLLAYLPDFLPEPLIVMDRVIKRVPWFKQYAWTGEEAVTFDMKTPCIGELVTYWSFPLYLVEQAALRLINFLQLYWKTFPAWHIASPYKVINRRTRLFWLTSSSKPCLACAKGEFAILRYCPICHNSRHVPPLTNLPEARRAWWPLNETWVNACRIWHTEVTHAHSDDTVVQQCAALVPFFRPNRRVHDQYVRDYQHTKHQKKVELSEPLRKEWLALFYMWEYTLYDAFPTLNFGLFSRHVLGLRFQCQAACPSNDEDHTFELMLSWAPVTTVSCLSCGWQQTVALPSALKTATLEYMVRGRDSDDTASDQGHDEDRQDVGVRHGRGDEARQHVDASGLKRNKQQGGQ